jgi:hypothetical protein
MLKPELLRAVVDCGFEHPSEVQHECIPDALLGQDIICQAKSGMGKTAVFVLTTLHLLTPVVGEVHTVVLCHTRELAFQIQKEYERFSKYLPDVKSRVFYGGLLPYVTLVIFHCCCCLFVFLFYLLLFFNLASQLSFYCQVLLVLVFFIVICEMLFI